VEEKPSQPNPPSSTNPQPATGGGGSQGSGLAPNVASLLCYLCGIVTGIIFLVIEKENKEIKFHAWQSIFLNGGVIAIFIVFFILSFIPFIGVVFGIANILVGLGYLIVWILALIKAYNGEHWLIPVVGNLAEQQVNKAA